MSPILYYLLIKPLSWVPLPLLYPVSDGLSWLFFRVLKFRRTVVDGNINRSFPEKSEQERRYIAREFYRHLCDLIFESVRAFSISEKELLQRCRIINPEIFTPYYEKGQSVIICAGHYNSWELMGTALDRQIPHDGVGLYKPLTNAFFDRKMQESRGRFGLRLVSIRKVKAYFEQLEQPAAIMFATDQSPSNPKRAYWLKFLRQDTGVLFGSENYARKTGSPVVFGNTTKVKRGHYDIYFELITEKPNEQPAGAITEAHTQMLEAQIRRAPQYWLWSHRRWKHKRPAELVNNSAGATRPN